MRALTFGLILGAATALLGVLCVLTPLGAALEENFGLWALFNLRGPRPHPAEVVVVSVDRESAERLGLAGDVAKWPRSYHAQVVDVLARSGAAVVVFDIFFAEAGRSEPDDRRFADAIRAAGNVVLSAYLARQSLPVAGGPRGQRAETNLEQVLPPLPMFAEAAVATAPFPLPKVSGQLSQYWTFKPGAGETPTLPVVAFQVWARDAWPEFLRLLGEASPKTARRLGPDLASGQERLERVMARIREVLRVDPAAARQLKQLIADERDRPRRRQLEGLVRLYQSADSPYLDLYGPPRAIRTIPYHQVIRSPGGVRTDLQSAIVFVGVSETLRLEQRDGFPTAFSDEGGLDTSGVELAATALANLLEDRHLRPLSSAGAVGIAVLWGFGLALICVLLPSLAATAVTAGAVGLWLVWSYTRFAADGSWWPLAVPLLVQTPLALGAALLWSVMQSGRERQRLRRAFALYVPSEFIDELLAETAAVGSRGRLVSGVCLATDAGQYTTLAERMKPEALAGFMNRYYAAVFAPIRRHGGVISDVVGDAALAIWSADAPSPRMRAQACAAACAVAEAMDTFNREAEHPPLPTRLGLHAGPIALGNVGAMDHYEFRAVGDTVNSAARIEALNKQLGTSVLASAEAMDGVDGFFTRRLGTFVLAGKSQSLVLHELLGLLPASDPHADRCALFAEALTSWEEGAWSVARQRFARVLERHPHDGPARFYLRLCDERLHEAPSAAPDPVVRLETK